MSNSFDTKCFFAGCCSFHLYIFTQHFLYFYPQPQGALRSLGCSDNKNHHNRINQGQLSTAKPIVSPLLSFSCHIRQRICAMFLRRGGSVQLYCGKTSTLRGTTSRHTSFLPPYSGTRSLTQQVRLLQAAKATTSSPSLQSASIQFSTGKVPGLNGCPALNAH